MKKVLIIFVVAIFAASMLTSCFKTCKCKYYDENGKLSSEDTITLIMGQKCKDFNREATDYQSKTVCK